MLRPSCGGAAAALLAVCSTLASALEDAGWQIDPGSSPYPGYMADPRAPRMRIGIGAVDTEIPDTTGGRLFLDAGTRYTLARFMPEGPAAKPFWIDLEGGIFMQLDAGESADSLGWDGLFGITAVRELNQRFVVRGGYRHLSSHIGDEYIERTGRARVSYDRDALVLGASYRPMPRLTAYVEPSAAFSVGNRDRQDPLTLDTGAQYRWPQASGSGGAVISRYAALHAQLNQETDWEPGVTAKLGWAVRGNAQTTLRFEAEAYTGRAVLGEFALDFDETYLMASFQLDFAAGGVR